MHALKGEAPAFAALTMLLRRQAPNKDKKNKMIYSRNFKRKFLQHLFWRRASPSQADTAI